MQAGGSIDARDELVLCIQSYVIRTPHHTIMVDSCVGNDKPRASRPFWDKLKLDTFEKNLAATGVRMDQIDYVMCTHLHVDHSGGNGNIVKQGAIFLAREELRADMARAAGMEQSPDEAATPPVEDFFAKSMRNLQTQREALNEQTNKLLESLDARKNRLFDPMLMKVAAGFLAPAKTGSFGESLGKVAGKVGPAEAAAMKEQQDIAQQKLAVAGQGLELQRLKSRDAELARYLGEGSKGPMAGPQAAPVAGPRAGGLSAAEAAPEPVSAPPTGPLTAAAAKPAGEVVAAPITPPTGTVSENSADCDPYEPGKSRIDRRWTAEHRYRRAGSYKATFRIKQKDRAVAISVANSVTDIQWAILLVGLGESIDLDDPLSLVAWYGHGWF